MVMSMKSVGGAQLQHVVVVSGEGSGHQTRRQVSSSTMTTRVERLQLSLAALTTSQPDAG